MDPRNTPNNGRVAAEFLRGKVDAKRFSAGEKMQIVWPLCDVNRSLHGPRDRQLLLGDTVVVYDELDGSSYIQSDKDGYCGYIPTKSLGAPSEATHWVSAGSTHVYSESDFKSTDLMSLSVGSRISALAETELFVQTSLGFVPRTRTSPIAQCALNPIETARKLLGTPYLWGGNSGFGIDCSGLVQAALLWSGVPCPGDSDQQLEEVGELLDPDEQIQKGDLLFWNGHVALASEPDVLIHANAHHMAVVFENTKAAIERIRIQGDGQVIAHKRVI